MNRLIKLTIISPLVFLAACVLPSPTQLAETPATAIETAASTSEAPDPSATVEDATATATSPPTLSADAARSNDYQFMQRPGGDAIRVMSYNVNWDSIFPDDDPNNHDFREFDRAEAFVRVMRAVQPDIVCLQEINYLRSSEDLGEFLTQVMGSAEDEIWQAANVRDNVIATQFELIEEGYELAEGSVRANLPQAAALIDLPDEQFGDSDLNLICAHFKAGGQYGDILQRANQADAIMAYVRDFRTPGGELDLDPGSPFVILGDFNVYETDPHLQLQTLVSGDISNEDRYGEDLQPDWDETPLEDVVPSHNGLGDEFYTWRNDAEPFNPGALDRIIYSDSVLNVVNAFVLNTMMLSDRALAALGLQADDVLLDAESGYYDHLPIVVDFVITDFP
ncbi:MAG: endonuclease/exonuclease/phosphatase family protein [Anaerolineales bacterium]